jgi:predicted TPR repeat methyltransferase
LGNATSDHLGNVYGATSAAEVAAHYDAWAARYDADMAIAGYRHPAIALALFARHCKPGPEPVLDAGCGTGLVGEWLGIIGYGKVHGLDISEGMLGVARAKGIYAGLTQAALGTSLPFSDQHFAGIVSAGVFTTGHVGHEALPELLRITQPGGTLVLTIKKALWDAGFAAAIDALVDAGVVAIIEMTPDYVSMPGQAGTTPSMALAIIKGDA